MYQHLSYKLYIAMIGIAMGHIIINMNNTGIHMTAL